MSLDPLNSIAGRENLNGNAPDLLNLLPLAAYGVRAPDGVIEWFNSKAAELWGRVPAIGDTDERFCGAHALYRADGSYMAHCDNPVAVVLRTGISVHEEEVIIERPDGSRVTVAVHVDPIRDRNGAIAGAVNFFYDITRRKQAERTTGLLASIIDSSDDAIISKSLDGTITSWNRSAERLFGYTADEAVGRNITLIVPLDRRSEEAMILDRLRQGQRVDHFETIRVRKDGETRNISVTISPVMDGNGRVVGASKVARDITDRKRAEADRQRFVTLAERCSEFIGMCDLEGRPFYVNDAALKLVGLRSLDELYKVRVIDFFFPEDHDFISNQFMPKVLKDGSGETEVRFRNFATGEAIWMIYNAFVIKDLDGEPLALGTFSQNITSRKRTELALRESEERLRSLADQLENEVFARTQELEQRNAEILQQTRQLRELSNRLLRSQDEERRRIARDLHDSAGQIVTVLGIHLASITQGAMKPEVRAAAKESQEMVQQLSKEIRTVSYLLHPPLLDERGLSQAIRWYMKGLADRSGLIIKLDISDDFGRLQDDIEVAIFRIVQEALTNIHRHSGGKSATIRLAHNSSAISLEIQDDGKGIPPEILAAIRSQRSGVGITGMRERVRHLGGDLDIQSDFNGTKVSVTLPLAECKISKADSVAG